MAGINRLDETIVIKDFPTGEEVAEKVKLENTPPVEKLPENTFKLTVDHEV